MASLATPTQPAILFVWAALAIGGCDAILGGGGGDESGGSAGADTAADVAGVATDSGTASDAGAGSDGSAEGGDDQVGADAATDGDAKPACSCPYHSVCASGGVCAPKPCAKATECNDPAAPAAEPMFCPDGSCRAWQCAKDGHCAAGEKCNTVNYKCYVAPTGCTLDAQCLDDDVCSDDVCDKTTGGCSHGKLPGCCNVDADCDDADPCTHETCGNHTCTWKGVAGCCSPAAPCDDGDSCTVDSCVGNACKHVAAAGCCSKDGQCDDGEPTTADSCHPAAKSCVHALAGAPASCKADADCKASGCAKGACVASACSYQPAEGAGCCEVDISCGLGSACKASVCAAWQCSAAPVQAGAQGPHLSYDFEAGVEGWTVEKPNATAYFHHSKGWAAHGQGALRFGVPGKDSFEGGTPNKGAATSPTFQVPPGAKVRAWVYFDGQPGAGVHLFGLDAVAAGKTTELWSKNANLKGNTGGAWKPLLADLGAFAGQTIALRWRFDVAVNFPGEEGKGLLLDAVVIGGTCP